MIILIVLLVLFSIGVYLVKKDSFDGFLGFIMLFVFGVYLIMHILFWSFSGYDYNIFKAKRDAFVETIKEARKNNNPIELAAIIHDISEWNQELAERKYNRSTFFLRDYVDKRTELLQPIK